MTASQARRQALSESRFFVHLATFAVGVPVLLGLNLVLGTESLWAPWAAGLWANVVLCHAVAVFGYVLDTGWAERRVSVLRGPLSEADVLALMDEALRARPLPDAAAYTLGQFRRRLDRVDGGPGGGDSLPDPYALDAVRTRRPDARPPEAVSALDDPFSVDRVPVDTPRLDSPPRS